MPSHRLWQLDAPLLLLCTSRVYWVLAHAQTVCPAASLYMPCSHSCVLDVQRSLHFSVLSTVVLKVGCQSHTLAVDIMVQVLQEVMQ